MKMLLGIVRPTEGSGSVAGLDIRRDSVKIRELAAYIPEQKSIYRDTPVRDFLKFYGEFFEGWMAEKARDYLAGWAIPLDRRIGQLSKGMTTKVILAAAMARGAKVLLLDEPTEGLDPASVEDLLTSLTSLAAEDTCVVMASHRLEEIERICDRVAFMQHGQLIASAELDDLRSCCKAIDVEAPVPAEMIKAWDEVQCVTSLGRTLRVHTRRDPAEMISRLKQLGAGDVTVHDLNLRQIYFMYCDPAAGDSE
jgi:ABC-2 type transport system ATP-binding protein